MNFSYFNPFTWFNTDTPTKKKVFLSRDQVDQAYTDYLNGLSIIKLTKKYNISYYTGNMISKGRHVHQRNPFSGSREPEDTTDTIIEELNNIPVDELVKELFGAPANTPAEQPTLLDNIEPPVIKKPKPRISQQRKPNKIHINKAEVREMEALYPNHLDKPAIMAAYDISQSTYYSIMNGTHAKSSETFKTRLLKLALDT